MIRLSKLWLFLVTLVGGLLMLALLVLLPELQRVRREDQTAGLQLAQRTSTLLLAEQAQRLVAAATQLASDAVLQTTLEEMGRGQAELAVLHSTAQLELQRLSRDKALGASFLLATDARGRVLARVGQDEAVYRDSLEGWPLVADALRGYRLDDLWLWQGTLYRVAAAPVVAPGRDRYVGALLVAQVVGNDLARLLAQVSSLDAVFLGAGQVVGASLPRDQLPVDELVKLRADGPPDRITVWPGRGEPVAFVELPGTAANQGAALVLIGRSTAGTSAWEIARGAAARGLPGSLLATLIAAMAVIFAVGLLLLRVEVEAPVERLMGAMRRAESSAPATIALPETRFRGPLRQLVRALNNALRTASSLTPPVENRLSIGNQITLPPAFELPPTAPVVPPAPPAMAAPSAASPTHSFGSTAAPVAASVSPSAATTPVVLPAPAAVATAPPARVDAKDPEPTPPGLPVGRLTLPSMLPVATATPPGVVTTAMPNHFHSEETRVATGAAAGDDLKTTYFRVYQDFVLARERCQESVEGLNFDLFSQRLQQSRDQIMAQHSCQTVQFQVHIKDGRATLRATPIWS